MSKKRTDKSRPAARPSSPPKTTKSKTRPARRRQTTFDRAGIEEVIARGDQAEMRRVAAEARRWLKDFQAKLDALKESVKELGG